MALTEIKKIQLIGTKRKKKDILELLQESGALDIIEVADKKEVHGSQEMELDNANLEFAIKLLSNYGKKRGFLEGPEVLSAEEVKARVEKIDYKKIAENCSRIETEINQAKGKIAYLNGEISMYSPWKKLGMPIEDITETATTKVILGTAKSISFDELKDKILRLSTLISIDVINRDNIDAQFIVIFAKELEKEVRQLLVSYKFSELELPETKGFISDYLENLKNEIGDNEKIIKDSEKELKKLGENLQDLHVAYDYLSWQLEKSDTEKKLDHTEYSFAVIGWMPKKKMEIVKEKLDKITKEYEITELKFKEGEVPPVILENHDFISPFESVSKIYGLPKADELDPTPFLATYFIIFFALCLTDAGYGLLMFITMALALKFLKLADGIRKLVRLLMYGGVVTFFIGALFGGWFGLTPDQVPGLLTYTSDKGETLFIFQKINALSDPITVLIISLALGFIQILMGVTMKFVHVFRHGNKKEALLDNGTWVYMLSGIGFFILASAGVLPVSLAVVGKWWVLSAAAILILTQGREKKSIIGKAFSGILSLYGLVGYMSDVLSYSRLLALGLATAIIGLAVNTIVGLAGGIPYIGWIFMIVIFIGGHLFNLVINALGSFIHSGRLQFVEFFTKFMEGGGDEFKPFSKKTKYIFLKK